MTSPSPKHGPVSPWRLLDRVWRGPERWLGLAVLVFIGFSCLTYSRTVAEYSSHLFTRNKYVALVDGMFNPMRNRHILLQSGLPVYDIKIGRLEWNTLQKTAEEAVARGWLNEDLRTWVPATFIHDGQAYKIEMRLRGDQSRHWSGPKKSYRIKFSDQVVAGQRVERYFEGKHQINLIVPQDKLFALGPFVNSVLHERGLVTPADHFAILKVNGVIHGLYYQAEHFDNPLLAGNGRPETTVFGLGNRAGTHERYTGLGSATVSDAAFDVGSLRRQVEPTDDLGLRAMQVLVDHAKNPTPENFARVRAVIDWEKYLTFRCLMTLCNTDQVRFGSDNLKFYYDSSRGLLEPVPWDVTLQQMPSEPGTFDFFSTPADPLEAAVLRDPELRLRRNRIMWQFLADGGKSLLARYDQMAADIRLVVWADVLTTPIQAYKMDQIRKVLVSNIQRTRHVLEHGAGNLNYRLDSDQLATLEFTALNASGIHLQEFTLADSTALTGSYRLFADSDDDGVLGKTDRLLGESDGTGGSIAFVLDDEVLPTVHYGAHAILGRHWEYFEPLAGRRRWFLVGNLANPTRNPLLWTPPTLVVTAMNAVTEEPIPSASLNQIDVVVPDNTIGITCYDATDPYDLAAEQRSLAEFLRVQPQFHPSAARPGAVELHGDVSLAGTVIVPQSVSLVVAPGTDITLEPGAAVLCFGGLVCEGTVDQRIRIHGRNGKAWGTFACIRPAEPVRVRYTDFSHGGQKRANGILFTGGLAVHEGDLQLEHCRFTDMRSEDAVNVKSGKIVAKDCDFERTASDAIDIDAGTGEVTGSRFKDIAGDGIDISYSQVTLRDNEIENARDKGVRVSENSRPVLENNSFRRCQIAVSCMDQSFAKVSRCTFEGNRLAIEAKRQKPMFGGGGGEFVRCVFAANDTLQREDGFSTGMIKIEESGTTAKASDQDLVRVAPK